MPIGVIINVFSVAGGGFIGTLIGHKLTDDFKQNINMIFGACSMGMGIASIVLMENMPAVIFAIIIGTAIGLVIHLGNYINQVAKKLHNMLSVLLGRSDSAFSDTEFTATYVTAIVLFCASGTGIYGVLVSGMSGDHSILVAKSILDFFTALIFACSLGAVISVIAVPQFIIFIILFLLAGSIYPLTTSSMINDFKACGGFIMLATGFRMIKVKMFPISDMLPSMILVMPLSIVWLNWILPIIS